MHASDQHTAFAAAQESPYVRHARQTLRRAIVYYGWDHPVVASAESSLAALLNGGHA